MRFPGSVFIGSLLILGLLSHGIVLMQLSHNPERGHRGPAEMFRSVQSSAADLDVLTMTAAAGFDLLDPRPW